MNPEPHRLGILLDNPILTRFQRAQFRPAQLVPMLIVVATLTLLLVWFALSMNQLNNGNALALLLTLFLIVLGFVGASEISNAVSGARASGMFDFHRISPLRPVWLMVGFFFGPVLREYLICAVALPVAFWLGHVSPIGIGGVLQLLLILLLASWLLHGFTLLGVMVSKKPKPAGQGVGAGIVVFFIFCGPLGVMMSGFRPLLISEELPTAPFFGIPLPAALATMLAGLPMLGFILLAATRKIDSDRKPGLTKPQAIACLATFACQVLGFSWSWTYQRGMVLFVLYALVIMGMIVSLPTAPVLGLYIKGLRRAQHEGKRRAAWWTDSAANRVAACALGAIVFLVATLVWELGEGRQAAAIGRDSYSLTIATGVFLLVGFALGYQYCLLRWPRRGETYFSLILFLVWIVPLLAGVLLLASTRGGAPGRIVIALCPWVGITTSTISDQPSGTQWERLAAIMPALALACVFWALLEAHLRRMDRQYGLSRSAETDPLRLGLSDLQDGIEQTVADPADPLTPPPPQAH